ncbi:MAG: hypothetical protein JO325_12095, partial [Solirubrobacterales bacterium]|nr:hypothetical protein [Solirubrobacterales bacterium]
MRPVAIQLAPASTENRPSPIRSLPAPRRLAAAAPDPSAETTVARHRLLDQLATAGRVTVVSAPAGSGKTSLLRSWIREAGLESTAAWLPAGRARRDPQGFWISLADAVRRTEAGSSLLREVTAT